MLTRSFISTLWRVCSPEREREAQNGMPLPRTRIRTHDWTKDGTKGLAKSKDKDKNKGQGKGQGQGERTRTRTRRKDKDKGKDKDKDKEQGQGQGYIQYKNSKVDAKRPSLT
jgi:hypothetical protein